jgi:hypothetical protein
VGFASNHSRLQGPEAVGNLAADLLFTCRLAAKIFQEQAYFGGSVLADYLSCPSRKFAPLFPPPGREGDYDEVRGIYFEDAIPPGQPDKATCIEEMDWPTLSDARETVASVMLDQVRHITGARIDFDKLLEAVSRIAEDNYFLQ